MSENRAEGIVNYGDGLQMHLHGPTTVIAGNQNTVQNSAASRTITESEEADEKINPPSWTEWKLYGAGRLAPRFKRIINELSWKMTSVKITKNYEREDLREPEIVVYPRMRKGIRFYKGEYAHEYPHEYVHEHAQEHAHEYAREEGFSVAALANKGELITSQQLVDMLTTEERSNYIALVGQAGSGKTTIMKRIARNVIIANGISEEKNILYKMLHGFFESQKKRYELVYYLSVNDIPDLPSVGVGELLFYKKLAEIDENDLLKYGYSWITQNQSKTIIFLDGLDQATWMLSKTARKIRPWDKASTSTIMWNLLSHQILPDVQLIVSSREHAVAMLPCELRPSEIVALVGLDPEDVPKLFCSVLGNEGEEAWNALTTTSPTLVSLSSVPLFLIFNAVVWKHSKLYGLKLPDSITGVMLAILSIMQHSNHALVRDRASELMKKLKALAYHATKNKKFTFGLGDLKEQNLKPEDTSHLIIGVPQANFLCQHLIEEKDFVFFFSHQTLQEIFAALYLAEMNRNDLKNFASQELHSNHWSVVRRFLCGILLSPEFCKKGTRGLLEVPDIEQKKSVLLESLHVQLKKSRSKEELLELFNALHEAKEAMGEVIRPSGYPVTRLSEVIRSSIRIIDFSTLSLSPTDVQAVAFVMKHCECLDDVNLGDCDLNGEMMEDLATAVMQSYLKVAGRLEIGRNNFGGKGMSALARMSKHCKAQRLGVSNCSLQSEHMKAFLADSSGMKLKIFDIIGNTDIGSEGMLHLGRFVKESTLEELTAGWCNLKSEDLKRFAEGAENAALKKLDISGSDNIGSGGFFSLGRFVKNSALESLTMKWCNLKSEHLEEFADGADYATLKTLDVSSNENLGIGGMLHLGRFVKNSKLENLLLMDCNLEPEPLRKFAEAAENAALKILNVNNNRNIGSGGMFHLGKLVKNSTLEEISAERCDLECKHLEKFAEGAENSTLRKLNVAGSERLGSEGMHVLGKLVKDHEVKELLASDCSYTKDTVQKLCEGLGDIKIDYLDLSDAEGDTVYTRSLLNIISHVNKELILQCWQVNESQQQELQDKLNEICSPNLTITLGTPQQLVQLKAFEVDSETVKVEDGAIRLQ